jgi:hypothetical protein
MGGGRTTYSCAAPNSCAAGSRVVACTSSQGCGSGQQCCYLPSANMPSMTNISQCMATCPAGARPTCATQADCTMGAMCQTQSNGVYGFMTCRAPPPCGGTADCMAGQVCCLGAAGASNPCVTGACPAGTPQVCGVPGDCGSGHACCTSAGDAGGGDNTCQAGATCPSGTTTVCGTSADCTGGLVCCGAVGGGTCQMQAACGMGGNRQICTTSAECPAAFPVCRMGMGGGDAGPGSGTCRVAADGGAPPGDAAAPVDAPTGG